MEGLRPVYAVSNNVMIFNHEIIIGYVFTQVRTTLSKIFLCCLIGLVALLDTMNGSLVTNPSSLLATHYYLPSFRFLCLFPFLVLCSHLLTFVLVFSLLFLVPLRFSSVALFTKLNLCKGIIIGIRGFPPNSKTENCRPFCPISSREGVCLASLILQLYL